MEEISTKIIQLYKDGVFISDIAKKLNTTRYYVKKIIAQTIDEGEQGKESKIEFDPEEIKNFVVKFKKSPGKPTDYDVNDEKLKDQIAKLIEEGVDPKEIADECGCTKYFVDKVKKDRKLRKVRKDKGIERPHRRKNAE